MSEQPWHTSYDKGLSAGNPSVLDVCLLAFSSLYVPKLHIFLWRAKTLYPHWCHLTKSCFFYFYCLTTSINLTLLMSKLSLSVYPHLNPAVSLEKGIWPKLLWSQKSPTLQVAMSEPLNWDMIVIDSLLFKQCSSSMCTLCSVVKHWCSHSFT